MKINLRILKSKYIFADKKCEELQEKHLVEKMMLRRRLTRGAKIAIYLASEVGHREERVVFGSAYGEVKATIDIVTAIYNKTVLSPTSFQNSVHNTPVSYLSIVSGNTTEITTVSDLFNTSKSVLKVGAIKALRGDKILLLNVDAFNFDGVNQINSCGTSVLESGIGMLIEVTEEKANIFINDKEYNGITPSLWTMLEIYEASKNHKNPIVEIEL